MTYRDAEPTELCRECRAPATATCPRCDGPCCAAHAPIDHKHRCPACERGFLARSQADRLRASLTGPEARRELVALSKPGPTERRGRRIVIAAFVATTGLYVWLHEPLLEWLANGLLFAWLGATRLLGGRARLARRDFLAERRAHELPPHEDPDAVLALPPGDDAPDP